MSASNNATDILYSNPVPNVIFDPVPNVIIDENFETFDCTSVGPDGGDVGGEEDENILHPTIRKIIEPQRVYGPHGEKRTQISAVKFMVDCCGLDVIKFYTGGNQKYALTPILERTQAEIAPQASTRQLRRWFRFYVENGRTKAEVRLQKKQRTTTGGELFTDYTNIRRVEYGRNKIRRTLEIL